MRRINIGGPDDELLPAAAVFTLAGTIAFERGLSEAAERDLKTAVSLDSGQSEAFFKLGQLYAQESVWMDSALNYMFAGFGFENEEKAILTKIGQIEESAMSEDRKVRLLARKKRQLENDPTDPGDGGLRRRGGIL